MERKNTLIKKIFTLFILSVFFLVQIPLPVQAAPGLQEFEQQINIIDSEFSTTNGTDSPTDNSLGLISFDSAEFDSDTVYFEAIIRCDSCTGGGNNRVTASLYSDSGSQITTVNSISSSYELVRSGSISISSDDYTVRFKRDDDTGTAYIKAARLIIVQSSNSGVTDTQTHIEVGNYESSTSTGATELTGPKFYEYDDDKFSGTKNSYFEATIKTNSSSTTNTEYFNNYDTITEKWDSSPSSMTDNNTGTYAYTTTNGQVQLLNSNTNAGSDLGTITKVEVRAYSYQDTGSTGTIDLRPVFSGSSDGDNHNFTPANGSGSAGWSSYFDITSDTNAPSSWSWSDVQNMDLDVVWNSGGAGNTGYVSKVEVQVTYEDNTIIAYAQLYNSTNSTVVATVSTSSESYQRVRSSALSSNWDTTNDDDYVVRIYTSNGSNAVNISNAKIIIDQTETGGIKKLELAHQLINTVRTQTNNSYTEDSYTNQYDPSNYHTPHTRKIYYEATMKTSGSTGYVALYNSSDSDTIDNPTPSELTTTSTSYERQISSNFSENSDWPTATKNFVPTLKASTSETTSVSSSRILIEIANIDPSLTFEIEGESIGETHNSITTTIATTTTEIDFGFVSPGTPEYGTHKLTLVTNDANSYFTVSVRLLSTFQGVYPANKIDPFTGSSATWSNPQTWSEPDGTTTNVDTGWIGANTTDTDVLGWSSGASKFGPIDTSTVTVMESGGATTETEYVTYGFEVNTKQPADVYSTNIEYNVIPTF